MNTSNSVPHSSPAASAPLMRIQRRGRQLIVPRGSDLSHACVFCGKPPIGNPIVRKLPAARWISHKSTGGGGGWAMLVLDLIEVIVSVIWFVVDFPKRRSRVIRIGLCPSHRNRYLICTRASIAGCWIGLPLIIVGLFAPLRSPWQSVILIIGLVLFLGGIFLQFGTPRLRLVSETKEFLCVEGAGEEFLKLYPAAVR